jgi:hypothetical protein
VFAKNDRERLDKERIARETEANRTMMEALQAL